MTLRGGGGGGGGSGLSVIMTLTVGNMICESPLSQFGHRLVCKVRSRDQVCRYRQGELVHCGVTGQR